MTLPSVVIPSWNTRELLRQALESLKEALPAGSEVIVVDNASRDGSARMVHDHFPWARLVRNPQNLGFTLEEIMALREARAQFERAHIKAAVREWGSLKEAAAALGISYTSLWRRLR